MTKQKIGLVGLNGSGKSTVCIYLKSKGYVVVSLSDVVRHHALSLNLNQDRDTLTKLANKLKKDNGLDYFAKESMKTIKKEKSKSIVFDSVRHPIEMHYLKTFNTQFISISSSIKKRYDRILTRGKSTDSVSFEKFKAQENYEKIGGSYGQSIENCMKLCEYSVQNDGDTNDLYKQVDHIILTIEEKNNDKRI